MSRAPFIFKIVLIPYFFFQVILLIIYVFTGFLFSFALLFYPIAPIIMGAFSAVFFVIVITIKLALIYLVIVSTSVYSFADISIASKRLGISKGLRVFYGVLQFIPIVDFASLIIIMSHLNYKSQLMLQTKMFGKGKALSVEKRAHE